MSGRRLLALSETRGFLIKSDDLDLYFSAAYEELRRAAARVRRFEVGQTINTTALVNEAYVKLAGSLREKPKSTLHLKRIIIRAMRRVLVDAARYHRALKRGGDQYLVTFDEERHRTAARTEDVIALDDALEELGDLDPGLAKVVEYRFFGGRDIQETAELLGVSKSSIDRRWRTARAWLLREMSAQPTGRDQDGR